MEQDITIYLAKADECLRTAESEFANGRYNSCANRCYYAWGIDLSRDTLLPQLLAEMA